MITYSGKYADAIVYADTVEDQAASQIVTLLNQPFVEGAKVRIMADVHAGAGCVIGFSADLGDKVVPNLVGVDIGCGVLAVNLSGVSLNFQDLDNTIREAVPSGKGGVFYEPLTDATGLIYKEMVMWPSLKDRVHYYNQSLGSLGGGNHFIEVGISPTSNKKYLLIHSGSRNLGLQVAKYYQDLAIKHVEADNVQKVVGRLKAEGKQQYISRELERFKSKKVPKNLAYIEGQLRQDYLNDMYLAQFYAELNRAIIADMILENLGIGDLEDYETFQVVHNYISKEDNIIRKGAVSAHWGEFVLIPLNMRDGTLVGIGKGNPEYNFTAPHGAGRLMSRGDAKRYLRLEDFEEQMKDVWTTSIGQSTLDEAPGAYKPWQSIMDHLDPTVEIVDHLHTAYNFKGV